jgi:molecular chaperone GrpE
MSTTKKNEEENIINDELDNDSQANDQLNEENVDELEEQRKRYLQLMADFQNYQKRIEAEKAVFGAMANMGLIQDMLEVFDDINLALNDDNLDFDNAKSSMKSAQDKIVSSIERAGVERIEVNVGDEFNKDTMEAISTFSVEEEEKKGKVIAVINSAFKYKDRDGIIKAAKVIVGK